MMMKETIHLVEKIDCLKSNWFVWQCEKELPDGTVIDGSVQADGYGIMIAEETFEAD